MTEQSNVSGAKSSSDTDGDARAPSVSAMADQHAPLMPFPIVGIGASAGGLEAFKAFFSAMPAEPGMAFVLVQRLQPTTKSILAELISRFTPLHVAEVVDGIVIEPNHVYIIPPDRDMALLHGQLHLFTPEAPRGHRLAIDTFFRSLASDLHERAIGIILSGTGSDGTLGVRAIAGDGGMVMVQDPQSAQYDGMPRSAISTDLVNYILSPAGMPAKLLAYVQQSQIHALPVDIRDNQPQLPPITVDAMQKIFIILRSHTGHDFSYYKLKTIQRRIERRMVVNQINQLADYVRYLQQHPLEVETLFRDFLIGVTQFFRDADVFALLQQTVIPQLIANRPADRPIRIWVPGCSTGEEAYSLAMLFYEAFDTQKTIPKVQIFATDIDDHAIHRARAGIYADGISTDISPERLDRFFIHENGAYVIKKNIRDLIVFAPQNVVEDPPFSKVDLISCRNLLIYLEGSAQKKLLPLFHYSLNPGGFLLLGNSETIGDFGDLFSTIDRKWKLFQRKEIAPQSRIAMHFTSPTIRSTLSNGPIIHAVNRPALPTLREVAEQELLNHYTTACILINEQCDILYIHGHTGNYLEPASGEVTVNLLRMARPNLRMELTSAVRKVLLQREPLSIHGVVIQRDDRIHTVNLTVKPVTKPIAMADLFLIVLEEFVPVATATDRTIQIAAVTTKDEQIIQLERELRAKEEYLQTAIEELEAANEELKSTNEELQSANEELQSTNEEMETAKEELQSVNEELMTVNTELQKKNEETSRVNGDLSNLLAGTQIGTIFLDFDLHIQRFTPAIIQVIPLIQSDIGRPLQDIVTNFIYSGLTSEIQQVLDTLIPRENAVRTTNGRWFQLRISPYRTLNNVIEGAVLTFVNITEQKRVEADLFRLTQVVAQSPNLIIITDPIGVIEYINPQVTALMGYTSAEATNQSLMNWLVAEGQQTWQQALAQVGADGHWRGEWQSRTKQGKLFWSAATVSALSGGDGKISGLLVTQEDITERKDMERLAAIARDTHDAITVIKFDGTILTWNPSAERLYGWREVDALAMTIFDLIIEDQRDLVVTMIDQLRHGALVTPFEISHRCHDGTVVTVLLTATTLLDGSNIPYAISLTEKDISR